MLHAVRLGFSHPDRQQYLECEAPLPEDMDRLVQVLKQLE
jgi:hypothetical protein